MSLSVYTVLCGTTTFGWISTSSTLPWQHNDAPPTLHPSSTSKYGTERNGNNSDISYIVCYPGFRSDSLEGGANNDSEEGAVPMETETSQTGLENPSVHQVLLEAYSNIGEPDSLYGVCASKTVSKETWMRLYEQEGEWEKSLST